MIAWRRLSFVLSRLCPESRRPALMSGGMGVFVAFVVIGCWRGGFFEPIELIAYDLCLRYVGKPAEHPSRAVIVGATEEDVRTYGWPLADDQLAGLLETLVQYGPRVIGLDLYRDLPEPRTGEHAAELARVLTRRSEIVAIYNAQAGIGPPEVLEIAHDRIGFNDLPADSAKVVRRGLLFMDSGADEPAIESFALQVARKYLAFDGIYPEPDPEDRTHLRLGRAVFRPFESNDGGYVDEDSAGYQFLLDFRRRSIGRVSFRDVQEGIGLGGMNGAVVLVGVMAESVYDYVRTPVRKLTYGVELHALVIDQILRMAVDGERPIRFVSEGTEALWIVGWGLIGAWVGHGLRAPIHGFGASVGSFTILLAVYGVAFRSGLWIPLASAAFALVPALGLATFYQVHRGRVERRALMQLFSRHVSKDIAEVLCRQSLRPGDWRRSTATVLFSDLRGFSSLSERMDPDALARWLNHYLNRMVAIVESHHGVINKFIGDAIMAMFGVPAPRRTRNERAEDAANAVRCAVAMRQALGELNAKWAEYGLPSASVRIGIFTGPLIAGCIGSSDRMEFTVLGDTVNTAARLESFDLGSSASIDVPCRILIGESTRALVQEWFELEFLGSFRVKGKAEPIAIYRVMSERGRLNQSHSVEGSPSFPLSEGGGATRITNRVGLWLGLAMVLLGLGFVPMAAGQTRMPARTEPMQTQNESPKTRSLSSAPRPGNSLQASRFPVLRKAVRSDTPMQGATNRALRTTPFSGLRWMESSNSPTSSVAVPVYQPPRRGAPKVRIHAGSRAASVHAASILAAFAPEHVGLTRKAGPTLYWYLSKATDSDHEFALVTEENVDPVIEIVFRPDRLGMGGIELGKHGIELRPGVLYRWSIAIVVDPKRRSKDWVAGGMIERVADEPDLSGNSLDGEFALMGELARAGIWYDLIDEIIGRACRAGDSDPWIRVLDALLRQVNLQPVNSHDLLWRRRNEAVVTFISESTE